VIFFCSSIKSITKFVDFSLNSKELASNKPHLFLAYSITATCNQRQIPKNGILFSLKCCTVNIFPSTHLSPNPHGIKTQLTNSNLFSTSSNEYIFSASIQTKLTLHLFATQA
jgi:hypothetical protein